MLHNWKERIYVDEIYRFLHYFIIIFKLSKNNDVKLS